MAVAVTTPDTTALRLRADVAATIEEPGMYLDTTTVRALCDGYDEAQRLREQVAELTRYAGRYDAASGIDAARQALAALVADLRALCDGHRATTTGYIHPSDLRAVIDRHAPEGDA